MSETARKKTLKDYVYSNPVRAVLCVLYAAALYLLMSRYGFLPRIISLPVKDGSISADSVFYYTGNSFNNLVQNANEARIPTGTIDQLALFSTNNFDGGGYYNVRENTFYFNRGNDVYSFRSPKKTGKKVLEYIDNKSISGNKQLKYNYAVPIGDLFFHLKRKDSVLVQAKGTHSLYAKSFQENADTIEEVGNILQRNRTGKISLNELLKVFYFFSNDKLMYWNPDSGRLVWFIRDMTSGDQAHFVVYDTVTHERRDYDSSAGTAPKNLVFFPWDESHFIAAYKNTCEIYKWDFVNNTTEYITKFPSTQYYTFRILEDNTFIAAMEDWTTGEITFYRQSTDTYTKLSGASEKKLSDKAAIAIGMDQIAVFEPTQCTYYSFKEAK